MSNWREQSQQEEKRVLNAWNFNQRTPASAQSKLMSSTIRFCLH